MIDNKRFTYFMFGICFLYVLQLFYFSFSALMCCFMLNFFVVKSFNSLIICFCIYATYNYFFVVNIKTTLKSRSCNTLIWIYTSLPITYKISGPLQFHPCPFQLLMSQISIIRVTKHKHVLKHNYF